MKKKMKKNVILKFITGIYVVSLIVFGCLVLWQYMRVSVPVGQQKTERRYVYLSPGHGELYWSYVARGVRDADKEGNSWTLLERYTEESKVISCMENAILADVDGIIMKSSRQVEEQIEMAHQADIPVIFFDSDIPGSSRDCYVGTDNYAIGKQAAELLVQGMDGKGKILVITRRKTALSQVDRIRALEERLQSEPEMEIAEYLEDIGDKITLKEELHRILGEHPDIRGLLIMEEEAADTLPELLEKEELDIEDFFTVSMEFTSRTVEYLRRGRYDVILMQKLKEIGAQSVKWLNQYIDCRESGGSISLPDVINLETIAVTEENLDDVLGGYDVEDLEWNTY